MKVGVKALGLLGKGLKQAGGSASRALMDEIGRRRQ